MAELRYNPLLRDWTMVASKRQHRPHMPKNFCPFCPGSGKVPENYTVHKYDNDFPALSPEPPQPDDVATELYQVREAYGKCEVILYSPEHTTSLPQLPINHIEALIALWTERFETLGRDPKNEYVMIFENRGEEVGVTMPHPHGQIYAYPYVPLKLRTELESCTAHHEQTGRCLICDMNEQEQQAESRIIMENEHFICYLPFFTDYPFGVFIVSKSHKTALPDFNAEEKRSLAQILKHTTGAMDCLFDEPFPYMMCLHQRPVDGKNYEDVYHFHIEFYTPLRDKGKIKYNASSETGAWAPCNPTAVEDTAPQLREAYHKFLKKEGLSV
ncbi:galactose-1-phosphate uridylyltransferase [Caldalkalibacillus salinus]|uniref:galactose-1-phosphate uridylyltransferase n=1 Tax=Caldalkalibacillus salinus TaxID=2803787 RepID=UPI0019244972|nr:galactose-1-phosphate uridylyltransferase [Caldalkalibacillus salinus]